MIQYKCDRCGKFLKSSPDEYFVITITPPEIWTYFKGPVKYYSGDMHFCTDCMEKISECINELGRND